MLLAQKDLNPNERRIELFIEDGKGTPKDAAAAANKLLDIDDVDVLITSTTGASMAAQPIATAKKRNLIAYCMDADIARASDYTMRYYIGIDEEAAAIVQHYEQQQTSRKVGILYAKVPALEKVAANTYIPSLEAHGHKVVFKDSYEINETNFRNMIVKLKASGAQDLILVGYGFEYPSIFKELEGSGLLGKLQILGGWGFLYTTLTKEQVEGVLVSGPDYVFRDQDLANAFREKYEAAYGAKPNFDAAFAYTVTTSLAENLSRAEREVPLKQRLSKLGERTNIVGTYTITPEGNMIVNTSLGVFRDGIIQPLQGTTAQ